MVWPHIIRISIRYTHSHTQFVVWSSVQINTKDCIALVFELFGKLYVKYGKWMFRSFDGKCDQNCKPYTYGFIHIYTKDHIYWVRPLSMRIWSQFNKKLLHTEHWAANTKPLRDDKPICPHSPVPIGWCVSYAYSTPNMFYHRWKFYRILQMNEWMKIVVYFHAIFVVSELVETGKRVRLCVYVCVCVKQKNSFGKTNFILSL